MARGDGDDTSVDERMEETPANYNIPNQRMEHGDESYEVIPEEEDGNFHQRKTHDKMDHMRMTDTEF